MVNNQSAGYDLPLVTWIWITVSYWVFVLQAIHDHEVKELTKRIDAQTKEDMRQLQRESKDKQAFNRYWSPPSRGVGWINCMPLLWNVSVTACVHLSIRPCICPSVRASVHPSVHLSIRPCICPSVRASVHPSVHLSIRPKFLWMQLLLHHLWEMNETSPQCLAKCLVVHEGRNSL